MDHFPHRVSILNILPATEEPRIVLAALTRLRWLAVVGQLTAATVATRLVHLRLPLGWIGLVIGLTALSNAMLHAAGRWGRMPAWLIQTLLLFDVLLLTSLLYLTGGPQNPFAALYLVHVAMAVLALSSAWVWVVVVTVAGCYGALLRWHLPLEADGKLAPWVFAVGNWCALVLASVLIAAFIGRVIRALRQRERELAAARDRAVKNEQLAALTTLAAGAAHELNTPLGTIALTARELELACDRLGDESMQDDARLIRREVDRCRQILSRMRLELGEDAAFRGPIKLGKLVERLQEDLDARDRARLVVRHAPDAASALIPSRALEQTLLVLIRNAFDASPDHGAVTLDIRRQDGHVRFEVRDDGVGMSAEMLRRAGEPFFTTKDPGAGMGLGLFLVRLVAEQAGGRFSIDSAPGKGASCVLELPDRQGDGNA